MSYIIDKIASECRNILANDQTSGSPQKILKVVEKVICLPELIVECFPQTVTEERSVLFEDQEFGFCICRHVYIDGKNGGAHDHGPTWAIYGQVSGQTEMADWEFCGEEKDGEPRTVQLVRTYSLLPGKAHLYNIGDIHSPHIKSGSQVLRIEGQNTDNVDRTSMIPIC
jgi:predicted metal-dependent enzyme (double-stranded beta helix superfamily)